MGFGLDIKNKPLEVDTTEWVEYEGILMSKMSRAGKLAYKKRRENEQKKSYNRERKNVVRNKIIDLIKNGGKIFSNRSSTWVVNSKSR